MRRVKDFRYNARHGRADAHYMYSIPLRNYRTIEI